jgi:adenylylsulfate kinase-like enzyme
LGPISSLVRKERSTADRTRHVRDDMTVLLLTGTVATGKTTVAAEIGEILAPATAHVIVDLDRLAWGFIPDAPDETIRKLRTDNLAVIWPNLRSARLRHVVISGAIATTAELRQTRAAIGGSYLTVVRLVTSASLLETRLKRRDTGRLLEDHLAIMPLLERSMNQANLEDFRVTNDDRSPREVAMEVLERIGWP